MARPTGLALPFLTIVACAAISCSNKSPTPTATSTDPTEAKAAAPAPPSVMVKIERETSTLRESGALVLGRVADARRAFIADEDDGAIVEVDLDHDAIVASTSIGTRARDLIVLADGRIAATLPDQGAVAIFSRDDHGTLHEATRVRPAEEPIAMALDPSDAMLYVTTGASHSLIALDAKSPSLEERARFSLGREPRAVLVTSDGERVMVTHASETFVSVVPAVVAGHAQEGKIETRDIGNRMMCGGGHCSGARVARNAQAIARVGELGIVVPAAQSLPVPPDSFTKSYLCKPRAFEDEFGRPIKGAAVSPNGVSGYGIGTGEAGPPVTFDLETINGKDGSMFGVGTPPATAKSCLLPRAAAATSDNAVLVACLGSARIMRYRGQAATKRDEFYNGGTNGFDLSAKEAQRQDWFTNGMVSNVTADAIAVPAGPTGIAVERDSAHAVVWSSFARTITRIDTAPAPKAKPGATAAATAAAATATTLPSIDIPRHIARDQAWVTGRTLFFTNGDKRISVDGRACGNCHVDGRDDGLTWKTPQGMRRTRMLAGQTTAGPFGWKGDNPTLDAHIKTTLKQLAGTGLPDAELTQLATFVVSIGKPPPSLAGASSTTVTKNPEAEHGRELFASAECANCHARGASDRVVHDVGTGGGYVTPTLAGVATRGQLMHDGRYRTLDELIASSASMGRGATLSPDDRRALVKYLETL